MLFSFSFFGFKNLAKFDLKIAKLVELNVFFSQFLCQKMAKFHHKKKTLIGWALEELGKCR
jgi:hypothetical protein